VPTLNTKVVGLDFLLQRDFSKLGSSNGRLLQSKRRVYVSGGTMATDNSDDLFSVAMLIDELKVRSASIVARPSRRFVRPSTTRPAKSHPRGFRPLV
jgi:hypothetical protein